MRQQVTPRFKKTKSPKLENKLVSRSMFKAYLLKYIFLALTILFAVLSVAVDSINDPGYDFSGLFLGPLVAALYALSIFTGICAIFTYFREKKGNLSTWVFRLAQWGLTLVTLIIITAPLLIIQVIPAIQERRAAEEYTRTHDTIAGTGVRTKTASQFFDTFLPDVYMPSWKTGSAVEIHGPRSVLYRMEYAPLMPNNDYKAEEYANPLNIPEYFTVYVTYPDDAIKKFLDPMANCDVENAIEMLSKPTRAAGAPRTCIVLGTNTNGNPIYGNTKWDTLDAAPDTKYAFTSYGKNDIHIFKQSGNAENEAGGELKQLLEWQKIYRKFDSYDFDAR